jgi:excinuclease ABC subunit B
LRKKIVDILDGIYRDADDTESGELLGGSGRQQSRGKSPVPGLSSRAVAGDQAGRREGMARADLADLIAGLNEQMLNAARELQFELAARLRDEISDLKKELRAMDAAGVV